MVQASPIPASRRKGSPGWHLSENHPTPEGSARRPGERTATQAPPRRNGAARECRSQATGSPHSGSAHMATHGDAW